MAKKTSIIIGLAGRKRAGKTTVATRLIEMAKDMGLTPIRIGFADPLKAETAKIFGPVTEENKATLRPVLQAVGTAMKELKGDDVWLNRLIESWQSYEQAGYNMLVVDDVRFPYEAEHIQRSGGQVWKVSRPSTDNSGDTHNSETSVDQVKADKYLVEENLEKLLDQVTNTWHEYWK